MSVIDRFAAMARRGATVAMVAAALIPAIARAQATDRGMTRKAQEAEEARQRARREAQEKLIERVDSLRWEFEHQRLSDEERQELRQQMSEAFRALDESMARMREGQVRIERAERAWSTAPDVRVVVRSPSSGYLGLSFDGMNSEDVRGGEHFIRFYQYPMIALVEPSSPAERAGIRRGDTLLALNGTDVVKHEIALSRMLVPEAKVTVRVRRDGDAKNLAVTVGRAPDYVMRRSATTAIAPTAPPARPMRVRVPDLPEPPTPPSARAFVWVFNEGVGGAKVETVTEGLGRALGVDAGVLVVRATAGTPAHDAGLRDGDVIVRAAGRAVASVRELQNVLSSSDPDEGVSVVVLRERKQKELTLHW